MGNDGGSIAKRRDLAKEKKIKKKSECSVSIEESRAKLCALSHEPLISPVLICNQGFLFNKKAMEEAIETGSLPIVFSHIKSLEDLKISEVTIKNESIICPVTNYEFNGVTKFVMMKKCGCVVAEKALAEIPSETCLVCDSEVSETVRLNRNRRKVKKEKKIRESAVVVDREKLESAHESFMKSKTYKALFER